MLDKTRLPLQFSLPVWLTLASLPFVFGFTLYANYQSQFIRIDAHTRDDPKARRRSKVALLTGYSVHNHELAGFAGWRTRTSPGRRPGARRGGSSPIAVLRPA